MTTTIRKRAGSAVAAIALVCGAGPAEAQSSVSEILAFLVTNQSVETGNFDRDRAAAQATSDTISRALLANLATLPVSSSSGGFVYRLNPELGTVERATRSFGPFFVERAFTAGRGAASFGMTFQHLRFTSLDGLELRDGTLVTTANQFRDEPVPYDVDKLALSIDADVATLYANVGLTEAIEVGVAAPLIALRLEGSRVNTYRARTFTQALASATSVGLADLVVRTKVTLFNEDGAGLAAAADLRLPTGREEDLLGTGSTSLRLAGLGSLEAGALSSHVNAGITVGGLARELNYGAALAVAATDRFTVTGEVLGRWIDAPSHITPVAAAHPTLDDVETVRLQPRRSNLNVLTLSPGLKWNVSATWVLVANVSVPLTENGLTSPVTPFVGIDYAFTR